MQIQGIVKLLSEDSFQCESMAHRCPASLQYDLDWGSQILDKAQAYLPCSPNTRKGGRLAAMGSNVAM